MTQKLILLFSLCAILSSCVNNVVDSGAEGTLKTAGDKATGNKAADADIVPVDEREVGAIVAERAEARWRALIDSDVDAAYGYLSPVHRKVLPIEQYQVGLNPGMWREIRVESTSCDPLVRVCEVVLFLKYDLKTVKGIEMKKKESWIEEANNWWYVPKK